MDYPRPAPKSGAPVGGATQPRPERLESWKEIAAYLQRDQRTLRRWEAREGLPVRRLGHHKGASVYALRHELDAWREKRSLGRAVQPVSAKAYWPVWAAALAGLAFAFWWLNPLPPPRLENIEPITRSGRLDYLAQPASDGARIYYLARAGDHWDTLLTSFRGGTAPAQVVGTLAAAGAGRNVRVFDVSRRGQLLLGTFIERGQVMPLWTMPAAGGAALRVGGLAAAEAVWTPDGQHVLYTRDDNTLWIAAADGSGARMWLRAPGLVSWMAWSPHGRRLRFTATDLSGQHGGIWEVSAAGSGLHQILPHPRDLTGACCGAWTPDGHDYLFTSGVGEIWALREHTGWRRSPRGPFQLTFGPTHFAGVVTARRAGQVRVVTYGADGSEELNRWVAASGQMSPVLPGLYPADVTYGRRGWLVYSDGRDRTLWRARPDGSGRLQLTPPALAATFPRVSPDGTIVAFDSAQQGKPSAVYTVAVDGDEPHRVAPGTVNAHDVDWAPDGAHLVLAHAPSATAMADARQLLAVVTLVTGQAADIPGSTGLDGPRWSPDGRWIAAVRFDQRALELYDRASGSWRVIAHGRAFGIPAWSEHGRGLYYQDLLAPGEPLYRWDAASGRTRTVAEFTSQLHSGIDRCAFRGLAPGNVPLISLNRGSNDLFAGELIP